MSAEDDRVFFKRFTAILVGLIVFTIAIILLAINLHGQQERDDNPSRATARLERLQPVAGVYTDETGRAAAAAADAAAERAAERAAESASQVAFGGSTDGEMIYNRACGNCHEAGAAGAPQLMASAWEGRLDKGRGQLVTHAINGFGAMPARGGRSDVSDEQIEASVDYMLAQIE